MYRPLSFTKNLGGLDRIYRAVRGAYRPGITLVKFGEMCGLGGQRLIAENFFIATRIINGREYVAEDTLITETLTREWGPPLTRLYLFAMLLNMPGQRLKDYLRTPSGGQNAYVRNVLYVNDGWQSDRASADSIEPWVRHNVDHKAGSHTVRKFSTNLAHFFEQCNFQNLRDGKLRSFGEYWGAMAISLFFDRYVLESNAQVEVDDLVTAAREREIHKLMGMPLSWFDQILEGAAAAYLEGERELFTGEEEPGDEHQRERTGPAPRQTVQQERIIRKGTNRNSLRKCHEGVCQICGIKIPTADGRYMVDYAHIKPLGTPHDGTDDTSNMLSLCPNHHRQFDRLGISIHPDKLEIIAPQGSFPAALAILRCNKSHRLERANLTHHYERFLTANKNRL